VDHNKTFNRSKKPDQEPDQHSDLEEEAQVVAVPARTWKQDANEQMVESKRSSKRDTTKSKKKKKTNFLGTGFGGKMRQTMGNFLGKLRRKKKPEEEKKQRFRSDVSANCFVFFLWNFGVSISLISRWPTGSLPSTSITTTTSRGSLG